MNNITIGLEGHFTFIARHPERGDRLLAEFQNLILDSGLNRMGNGQSASHCKVGSGSTAPNTAQTALVNQLAQTTNIYSELISGDSTTNMYGFVRRTYRFAQGVATGNLSEVGIGWDAGLFSRALIKDNNGDPTTITVLADETLDVIYELRAYAPVADSTFNVTVAGTARTFTVRPCNVNNSTGPGSWGYALMMLMNEGAVYTGYPRNSIAALGDNAALAARSASTPSGTFVVDQSSIAYAFTDGGYSNNSYRRTIRATWATDKGSVPFGGFMFTTNAGVWQAVVSPVIEKDATKVYTMDITVSWARRT